MALTLSSDATPQVFAKKHPRFFVREIHKGSSWKYQKPKPLRCQTLQPQRPASLPKTRVYKSFAAQKFCLKPCRPKTSNTCGVIPVALCCTFTMRCSSKT